MSHQNRRAPLPAEYQYPTHGVDCDCPPCRDRVVAAVLTGQQEEWAGGVSIRQYNIDSDQIVTRVDLESLRITSTAYGWGDA